MDTKFKRLLSLAIALAMVIGMMPFNAVYATEETEAPSEPTTITADDARIHRSSNGVKEPAEENGAYKLEINPNNVRYDYNKRSVKPCLYNLRDMMTNTIGTSTDKGINRYPYVVIKVNAPADGYYDLGMNVNMDPGATIDSWAIVANGFMHIVNLTKPYDTKQTVVAKDVYLTQGEHDIFYIAAMPENEGEVTGTDKYIYPWANFWAFTFEAGLEVLDASSIADTDVENIMKDANRIEVEDTRFVSWNIYSKTETNASASGDTVVGGPSYGQCQQSFEDLTANGLIKGQIPYVQFTVNAPAAGTYYLTVGANPGTSSNADLTNSANPVPFVAVIANDNAPVKAQFDGAWGKFDSVTVAVQLQAGDNVIRCTSATAGQYAAGSSAWVNLDYFEVQKDLTAKRTGVNVADSDNANYLYLSRYQNTGDKFAAASNYGDLQWDYPSLYETMTGIYKTTTFEDNTVSRWPYIAFKVNAPQDGEYQISAKIGTDANASTIGMIVDGATYVVDITATSGWMSETAYLSQGEHVIIFTSPMPRDIELADGYVANDKTRYTWLDYYAFELDGGLSFLEAPAFEEIQASMQTYSRVEAEDTAYATATGGYAEETSKTYTRRSGECTVTVKGTSAVSASDYVEYKISAAAAGTYNIRIGAYLEGEGTVPYGTIVVNGISYKAQFASNWGGYDVVNLPVQMQKGTNIIQCFGVSADQTETNGWIGYDFIDLPEGVNRTIISATDDDCADYLYLNRYKDSGSNFGGPNYNDMRYDYPSLYETMTGIYTAAADGTMRWPYIAFTVNAPEAGEYEIAATIERNTAVTLGMIVDGATYVVDVTSNEVSKSVYLTEGEHIVIFTAPIPRDMELIPAVNNALYPWMNYVSFEAGAGLSFMKAPTFEDIKASMQNYSRVEAENTEYVTATGGYAAETTKTYTRRSGAYTVTVKGTDAVSASDYVEYKVYANEAGTYVIRIGAYLEGEGTMPYGTIVVNDTTYQAQFSGNWNGYDAVNLAVSLNEGVNTIACYGVSADQTETTGWIGYDFIDLPDGVNPGDTRWLVKATDDDCADYLYMSRYEDTGDKFADPGPGNAARPDMQYDYPSLYEAMTGIYTKTNDGAKTRWPYVAFKVNAPEAGEYQISANIGTNENAQTLGMIVDGATYVVDCAVTFGWVGETVYLSQGEHVIVITTPMPRDLELAAEYNAALYPWIDYYAFELDNGLGFLEAPTFEEIQASVQNYHRIEAENSVYATATVGYAEETSKTYTRRSGEYTVTVKGTSAVSASDYVEYKVCAAAAGTYVIRIGAYLEGEGTVPYGTIVVNDTTYQAQFSGNWGGYDAVNLPVQLQEGENVIRCYGVSEDQTETTGWIGYDFIDFPLDAGVECSVDLTHISLNPGKDALGFKAAATNLPDGTHVEISLWVNENKVVTKATDTLRLINILASNGGETTIYAKATVVDDQGNVIAESAVAETTLKETLETVNAGWGDYTEAQQAAVQAYVAKFADKIPDTWNLDSITG